MVTTNLKKAERATIFSSILILLLSLVKFVTGFFSNSIVLMTDALHSFTDLITNAASWVGLRVAQRKPDEKFPYGYFKAESFSALFISLFIIYLSYTFFMEGFNALSEKPVLEYPFASLSAALVSIITSFFLYKYLARTGRETNSQSLIANGKEKRVDVLTSSVVFVTLVLSISQVGFVEGVVTMLISLIVFREGLLTAKEAVFSLMDVSPDKKTEKEIIKAIAIVTGVEGFGDLKLRKSGPFIFGEVDVMVREQVNVKTSKLIGEKIERDSKKMVDELYSLFVRVVPYEPEELLVAIPVNKKTDTPSISNHFARSNQILLLRIKDEKIMDKKFVENNFKSEKIRAGFKLSHFLVENGVDVLIAKEIGEISFHILRDHLVDVRVVKKDTKVDSIIQNFLKGKIESAEKPTKPGREYWEK
jgi:cation diffusion facilitator family transporter